eukprot:TRINITY_DN4704_c0_g1_i3.p1 TRINITY_DN4704_c0_g1~~TRINITY_DN4704_c0_g1_i3.p1  ORF type:complete len:481 (-),score=67.28 TRINITY_DN4704_c0_g1_i3:40-1482(-)
MNCIQNEKIDFKGFGLNASNMNKSVEFTYEKETYELNHGSIVLAAITSCTNTSNEFGMIQAGLVAKRACQLGLKVKPYIKTTLSPGSGIVLKYLQNSGLDTYLNKLGFYVAGLGCMTCIGNSGNLMSKELETAIQTNNLIAVSVLSGNRNFSQRVHALTPAAYLASPALVVAFAIAGTINIDLSNESLGVSNNGSQVFLSDLIPGNEEIIQIVNQELKSGIFIDNYQKMTGSNQWSSLKAQQNATYEFDPLSSYIKLPPYFKQFSIEPKSIEQFNNLGILLLLGDSISTDDISPVSAIQQNSVAGKYLIQEHSLSYLHSFGARRGNHDVMIRGMFQKKMPVQKWQAQTIFEACQKANGQQQGLIILAGEEYGCGSSRDWAAKALALNGVRVVIAKSFERIHRTNLIQMGILPLQFCQGQGWESIGVNGNENVNILIENNQVGVRQKVRVQLDNDREFETCLLYTSPSPRDRQKSRMPSSA